MPGAAALAALGAAHGGAGYVQLLARTRIDGLPHAIVQRECADAEAVARILADERIGAVVVGPGLGARMRASASAAFRCGRPLVIDADALAMLDDRLATPAIATPHAGEFARMGGVHADPHDVAVRLNVVVLLKGSTTTVTAPDGRRAMSESLPATLATAGTGDVLAGLCGTMLAQLGDPFDAACAAVWLHGEAARMLARPFVADELARVLGAVVGDCW